MIHASLRFKCSFTVGITVLRVAKLSSAVYTRVCVCNKYVLNESPINISNGNQYQLVPHDGHSQERKFNALLRCPNMCTYLDDVAREGHHPEAEGGAHQPQQHGLDHVPKLRLTPQFPHIPRFSQLVHHVTLHAEEGKRTEEEKEERFLEIKVQRSIEYGILLRFRWNTCRLQRERSCRFLLQVHT